MPAEVDGIPLHPLLVHLPVVLVPALALLLVLYLLVPPLRQRIGWAVTVLAVLSPAAVFGARFTGQRLADSLPSAPAWLADHRQFGDWLLWLTIAVLPLTLLFGALERGRRAARARAAGAPAPVRAEGEDGAPPPKPPSDDPASGGRRLIMIIIGVLLAAVALASAYVVVKSGQTGAAMVW